MKSKSIVTSVVLVIFTASVFSQTKLIEKVTRKGTELVIPYEKYQLENGLTLIVHEDHSDPVVYVDVTYHVGSAREQEGRSGFAHFFEHMMFEGSEHAGKGQHFKILTEAGGTLNGSTTTDRTNYWEVIPSNQLETALWLESDRMGFLLDSVTQEKFENQRSTVKNERGQNYDNRPYGLAGEKINAALYPTSHPYSWLTIGYIEDLNRVDVNDLKKFFMRWYGPNNATLTISGDVNTQAVIKYAEKYFGSIPRGAEVKQQTVAPVVLEKDRYVSYEDNIQQPQLSVVFPTVAANTNDEPALDVLADILGGGKTSIFYKNFVKTQLAQSAFVYHRAEELAGTMNIVVRGNEDKSLSVIDSTVRVSLAEFEKRGVTDDDLLKYKTGFETDLINSLSSVQGKGTTLAANQTFTGNPNYIQIDLARYQKITKEEVMNAYNKYVKNKFAVVLSVVPKGKLQLAAKPDNYVPMIRNTNAAEGAEYKNLVYNKAKDNFDRKVRPAIGPAPVVIPPDYWTDKFENGIKVIGAKTTEIPTVTIQLNIQSGHRFEPKAKSGISGLTAAMMNEGTLRWTAEELSEKLDRLGSSVNISSGSQDVTLYVSSLTKNLDSTLVIVQDILLHPRFDANDFDRVKNQRLAAIKNQSTQATTIANNVYARLLYGDNHIMSVSGLGTKETVTALTVDDIKDFYKNYISPSVGSLIIVGDIDKDAVLAKLNFLKKWQGSKVVHGIDPALPKIEKTKIYFVNKDKAPQSEIRIGYMALPYDATGEYYRANVMNFVLGGAFTSRINMDLREVHGYTYGARSSFSGSEFVGPFTASAGVRTNSTDSSIFLFMKEIIAYSYKGITKDELTFTQNSMGQSEALKYESPQQKAGFMSRILEYNLTKDYTTKQSAILKTISPLEINKIAKERLPYKNFVILVVGDRSTIFDKISKLGYEVIELDADGNPLHPVVKSDKKEDQIISDDPPPTDPKKTPYRKEFKIDDKSSERKPH